MGRVGVWSVLTMAALGASSVGVVYVSAQTVPTAHSTPSAAAAQSPKPASPPSPAPATASGGTEPQTTTATYGDWTLRCSINGTQRICEAAQALQPANGQGTIAEIAVGRRTAKDSAEMTVELPTNVTLTNRVVMLSGPKDEAGLELTWTRCFGGGCFAQAELQDDALKAWRAQPGPARLRYVTGPGQPVELQFSLRGFRAAIEALFKTP